MTSEFQSVCSSGVAHTIQLNEWLVTLVRWSRLWSTNDEDDEWWWWWWMINELYSQFKYQTAKTSLGNRSHVMVPLFKNKNIFNRNIIHKLQLTTFQSAPLHRGHRWSKYLGNSLNRAPVTSGYCTKQKKKNVTDLFSLSISLKIVRGNKTMRADYFC